MAAKVYYLKFGSGDPRTNTGLAPTFLQFYDSTGQTYAAPSIAEIKFGGVTASGIYGFSYLIGISTQNPLYFLAYSATTLANTNDAYISGVLDPVLAVDQQLTGIGNTQISIGNTTLAWLGTTASSYGSTSADPSTIFGYVRRLQEFLEGDQILNQSSGQWLIYNRAALGTTTLLRTKTVGVTGSLTTRTGV